MVEFKLQKTSGEYLKNLKTALKKTDFKSEKEIKLFKAIDTDKNCVNYVQNKIKDNAAGTIRTDSKTTQKVTVGGKPKSRVAYNINTNSAQQGKILADKLYEQIQGASLNANTIKLLKQINPENVIFVLDAYNKKTKGKESLAQAIDNEWGLDEKTVKEYICPALVKLAKNKNISGVYFGDYMKKTDIKSLNEWINYASTKIKTSLNINLAETTVLKKAPPKNKLFNYLTEKDAGKIFEIYENSRIKQQGQRLGKNIYKQIQGLSNPLETAYLLDMVNQKNVVYIMKEYEKQSKGKETLIDGIAEEYGLTYEDCKDLGVKLYKYAQENGIKVEDLKNEFNNSNDIETATTVTKKIYARINASKLPTKQTSLKPYINQFGKDYWYLRNFSDKTGVSFETAILNDPTINRDKKIDLIRNSFTYWAQIVKNCGVSIDDIIKNANDDLQALCNDNDFSKYSALYETTIEKLKSRIYKLHDRNPIETNGKIDKNFSQGAAGDCWLLAAIKGISRNPKGLKILNDSIKVNSNGTVTVHLKGVDKTYTISQKEINNATELSSGDGDVRALEIAVNRYLREDYKENNGENASIDGGCALTAYKILTGKGELFGALHTVGDLFFNPEWYGEEPISDELISKFNNQNQITCVAANSNKKTIEVNTGSDKKGILTTDHEYTVTHADQKYVYLINPWDTATEIKVDRKTFKEFFTHVDSFEL